MADTTTAALPQSFNDLIKQSDIPVLVDFWAEWCGPCRVVGPIVEQIAREYKGKIRVVKVNVDDSPRVAAQYGIQSIPTIMIFDHGEVVMRQIGALPHNALASAVDQVLS